MEQTTMGAVIPLRPRYRTAGNRRPVLVQVKQHELVEPWMELDAISAEGLTFASGVVALARRIEQAVLAGQGSLVAMYADRLERAGTQQGARVKRAQVLARLRQAELEGVACADAIEAPGHGRAA